MSAQLAQLIQRLAAANTGAEIPTVDATAARPNLPSAPPDPNGAMPGLGMVPRLMQAHPMPGVPQPMRQPSAPGAARQRNNDRLERAANFQSFPQLRGRFFQEGDPSAGVRPAVETALSNPAFQAAQMRAPQLPGAPTEQEVTAGADAIGNRLQQARELSMRGRDSYPAAEFLARPEGEDQMEDFAFRRMVVLGDKAPRALQESWLGIQQAKRQRLMARADHHAAMIRHRHGSDLQLRNLTFAEYGANRRQAASDLMRLRLKQADMEMASRVENMRATSQLKGDQRDVLKASIAAEMRGQPKVPTVEERTKLEEKFIKPAAASYEAAMQARKLYQVVDDIGARAGLGIGSRGIQAVLNAAGARGASEFRLAWSQMKNTIVKNFSAEAGARAIDTPVELRALADTVPGVGDDPEVIAKWVDNWIETSNRAMKRSLNGVNDMFEGYGDRILEDLTGGSNAVELDIARQLSGAQ